MYRESEIGPEMTIAQFVEEYIENALKFLNQFEDSTDIIKCYIRDKAYKGIWASSEIDDDAIRINCGHLSDLLLILDEECGKIKRIHHDLIS